MVNFEAEEKYCVIVFTLNMLSDVILLEDYNQSCRSVFQISFLREQLLLFVGLAFVII